MKDRRFAFLKGTETLLGSRQRFGRYGDHGVELSDLLPYHRDIVDDVCFLKGMTTDVFNHGPAKLFLQSGSPQPGRPSMGSWVSYGIGSEAEDLPGFVVLAIGSPWSARWVGVVVQRFSAHPTIKVFPFVGKETPF